MNYRVLIVDDEEIMRDSFKSLLPWSKLGFEVCALLGDGKEAMDYIQNNAVDLIITDIKMPFFSGIDIAQYVQEHAPNPFVVLLSGYEDFDYARKAITYGVRHYWLKTMPFSDIVANLSAIKQELDARHQEKQYLSDLLPILKKQCFVDLILGAIITKEELLNRLYLAKLDQKIVEFPCAVLEITLENYDEFLNHVWNFGKSGLENALEYFFNDVGGFCCSILSYSGKTIRVFVSTFKPNCEPNKNILEEILIIIQKNFEQYLKIHTQIKIKYSYSSLLDILNHKTPLSSHNTDDTEEIKSIQQLILSYASAGNISEVRNLFSVLLDRMDNLNLSATKNLTIELFSLLSSKLKEFDINISVIPDFSYNKILNFQTIEELKSWGYQIIDTIFAYINNHNADYNEKIIEKVKLYIKEHCCDDITLNDVANFVFLSPDYLSRLFKKYTNENFMDCLVRARMEKAMELLKNENCKIYEVSQMVCYKTTKYFTKLFKLHTGMTPTEYRNQVWK